MRAEGRNRVVIESVIPTVNGGRFAVKREVGDEIAVEADVFADGHDVLGARLQVFGPRSEVATELPFTAGINDRWSGSFVVDSIGHWSFVIEAWIDHLGTWRRGTSLKVRAGVDVSIEREIGARLLELAASDFPADADALSRWVDRLRGSETAISDDFFDDPELVELCARCSPRRFVSRTQRYEVVVDPVHARFSAWYELFPRSASPDPNRPGTLTDVAQRAEAVAAMGFDVLYLPPIHPIGFISRKGRNNMVVAGPGDPGSPWGIGSPAGGHDAVHPELGTEGDLALLVERVRSLGMELALDLAWNCAPDHPWVSKHPEWFTRRPDGTIQYAENPPKRYQDIYPLDFETDDWQGLWQELLRVVLHWSELGVKIFRVDNPHTKAFAFWEWMIAEVKARYPETLFLSEAFTRPKVMHRLAKLGFSQSYTYFAWRNSAWELREYFTELSSPPGIEYFRPNVWPNTPDILTEYLQHGGRPAFVTRGVLAAVLSASYGVYGPMFELCVNIAREPGSEEYLDSEKYEVRHWQHDQPHSLAPLLTRLNAIRRAHPSLQRNTGVAFHPTDNDQLLCFSKSTPDHSDTIIGVVNLDPHNSQSGWTRLDLDALGLAGYGRFGVTDLLHDVTYTWDGPYNYVGLAPWGTAAHVLEVRR